MLTTESISPFAVRKRLGIVTAEYVYRSTILSSLVAEISSIGETRQSSTQNALKEARAMALTELRREAHNLGADAVVAVDLDYSEVAGAGSPMMFLVASGTAIEIDK
ncbi:YbjQ family protein [Alteromonas sp. 07-89-2]|nr:YbjQ family protein [Alteromonas sp. 07-89-2]